MSRVQGNIFYVHYRQTMNDVVFCRREVVFMGFLTNLLKSSLSKKCPDGYKIGGVTEDGFIYYEKIEADNQPKKLTTAEKERIMVQKVTTKDMLQFPNIPYQLNCPIHKVIAKNTHPFAYMDLNAFNQSLARNDLTVINRLIVDAQQYIPLLKSGFSIDIGKIAFHQYDPGYGYTRLMCTPYTFTGKLAKYPLSLSYMTRQDVKSYSALGELFYDKSGNIAKGNAIIRKMGIGWFFTFKTVSENLTISEAKTTLRTDKYGLATTVYKKHT